MRPAPKFNGKPDILSFITQSDKAGSAWNAGVRLVYPQALGTKLLIG